MLSCKAQLDAVINTLRQTNWQGAGPVIAALGPTDLFICDLFNRCEKYWLAYLERQPGDKTAAGRKASITTQAGVPVADVNLNPGEKA